MKKIIKGKLYNTETAKLLGEWENNYSINDFKHVSEHLYLKKIGEYFLHGEGGPLSIYAEQIGIHGRSGGERIRPLTYAEAREWAEEKLEVEEYEKIFGEVSEDDLIIRLSISMTCEEAALLKQNAQKANMTISAFIVSKCLE